MTTIAVRPGGARGKETGRSGPPTGATVGAEDTHKVSREERHA
jgi:hypothetical protein